MRMRVIIGSAGLVAELASRLQRPGFPYASLSALAALTILSGCAGSSGGMTATDTFDSKWGVSSSQRVQVAGPITKGGGHYKLGRPYQIGGKWYVPRHEPYYDRQGVGSWYGTEFHGRKTANGEVFDMNALTAAHPTLPLPSYAYVTNLRNGRTILVRINDRGPYVANREIDLSRASAKALGYADGGLGQVRVRWAGHAPMDGDDSREQAFLRNQPWNGGRPQPAIARFDRPAPPLADRRYPPQQERYAQDMNRRTDAEDNRGYGGYDQRRDDPRRYDNTRYEQAPAQQNFDDSYSPERQQLGNGVGRQAGSSRDYADAYRPPNPSRPRPAYEADEPDAPQVPLEPRRPASPDQMWSPFDHREQVRGSARK